MNTPFSMITALSHWVGWTQTARVKAETSFKLELSAAPGTSCLHRRPGRCARTALVASTLPLSAKLTVPDASTGTSAVNAIGWPYVDEVTEEERATLGVVRFEASSLVGAEALFAAGRGGARARARVVLGVAGRRRSRHGARRRARIVLPVAGRDVDHQRGAGGPIALVRGPDRQIAAAGGVDSGLQQQLARGYQNRARGKERLIRTGYKLVLKG